eukprot:15446228-Alexandrium_andersonii.AAC.1
MWSPAFGPELGQAVSLSKQGRRPPPTLRIDAGTSLRAAPYETAAKGYNHGERLRRAAGALSA